MQNGYHFDRSLWIRFWGEMLVTITSGMIWPFLSIYLHNHFGASYTTIGLIFAWSPIASTFGIMLGGHMADRRGRRKVMLLSLLMSASVLIGYSLSRNLWMFAGCIIIQGFFGSMFDPAANAMVADVTPPEHRQEAYGLLRISGNVGSAIGPLLGMVMFFYSPTKVFFSAAFCIIISMTITRVFIPETLNLDLSPASAKSAQDKTVAKRSNPLASLLGGQGYGLILKDRLFLLYIVSGLIAVIAYMQTMRTFPLYLDRVYHVTNNFGGLRPWLGVTVTRWLDAQAASGAKLFALLLSMNSFLVVFFQMPITRIIARYKVGLVLATGIALEAVGLLMLSTSITLWWMVLSFIVFTLGEMLESPSATKLVADLAPDDMRGRYMGAASLRWIVGSGLASVLGGFFLDRVGGATVLLGASVVAMVSVGCTLLLHVKLQQRTTSQAAGNSLSI